MEKKSNNRKGHWQELQHANKEWQRLLAAPIKISLVTEAKFQPGQRYLDRPPWEIRRGDLTKFCQGDENGIVFWNCLGGLLSRNQQTWAQILLSSYLSSSLLSLNGDVLAGAPEVSGTTGDLRMETIHQNGEAEGRSLIIL